MGNFTSRVNRSGLGMPVAKDATVTQTLDQLSRFYEFSPAERAGIAHCAAIAMQQGFSAQSRAALTGFVR